MRTQSVGHLLPSILGLGLLASVAFGDGPAVGPQFQVNTYTTDYQQDPAVAKAADGAFVVVWTSYGSPGTDSQGYSIQGQRFAADGQPLGGQFQVNTYTTNYQQDPAVAVADDGDFVVVWESRGSGGTDSASYSIQGQRYAADGSPLGGQFQVNSYTTSAQRAPAVAVAGDGGFVVVWDSFGSGDTDTLEESIQGQRFSSDGSPLDAEFQVNSYTIDEQSTPSVAVDAEGNFVVVWRSYGSGETDSSNFSIQGQRFAASGSPLGDQFQINSYTTSYQVSPAVASAAGGAFIVVWDSNGSGGTDSSQRSVQGQRYAADGFPSGGEFQLNTYTTSFQIRPAVASEAGGDFVVAWTSYGSEGTDSSYGSIQGRRYAADGSPSGSEFQVNSYTSSVQYAAAVDVTADGDFVVAWASYGSVGTDTSAYSVQGQRFGLQIFADGFESGDTSAWTTTVP